MTLVKTKKNGSAIPSLLSDFFDNDKFFKNQLFERNFDQSLPAVNIKESANQYNIEFAAPGFNKNDFKINIEENILTISAEKKQEKKETKDHYTRKEFSFNSFSRSFTLPQTVNTDKVEAKYVDGILKLNINKKEQSKSSPKKEIKIS